MRIRSKRSSRVQTSPWRIRAVQLAFALTGTALMTAIAAAAIGAKQGSEERAMTAAIIAQQIANGAPVSTTPAAPSAPAGVPANEAVAREKILTEATMIEAQMKLAISATEKLKTSAYKAKDIIRLNTITSKLQDMRQIQVIAEAAIASIREPGQDLFVMRAKLNTIRQGAERMRQAMAEAEAAEGDSVNSVSSGIGPENAETAPSDGVTDPSNVAAPTNVVERPGYASPYL
jgi:hypothetical protein